MHKARAGECTHEYVWPKSKGYNPQAKAQPGVDSEGKEDEEMRDEEEQLGEEATEVEREKGREDASEGQIDDDDDLLTSLQQRMSETRAQRAKGLINVHLRPH